MRRELKNSVILAAAASALLVSGCRNAEEEQSDPAPSPDDGRSIFQQDPTESGESMLPPPVLLPLETTLSFPDGTPELTEAVRAELATIVESPQVDAGGSIVLRGHSDSAGSDEINLETSRARAEAVGDFLVENGIAEERIKIIAFGEQNPIEPNALPDGSPNEEGRAANRRVEVTVETGRQVDREQTLIETLSEAEQDETQSSRASDRAGRQVR